MFYDKNVRREKKEGQMTSPSAPLEIFNGGGCPPPKIGHPEKGNVSTTSDVGGVNHF